MDIREAVDRWVKDITVYLDYLGEMGTSEYNAGFADGINNALESLKAYLDQCDA